MTGPAERTVWTRVDGLQPAGPLDLMAARFRHHRYAPHAHAEFTIGVALDGFDAIRYRGAEHVVLPGSVVVLEPDEAHTGGPARQDAGYAYRAMYPSADLLAEAAGGRRPHFRAAAFEDAALARGLDTAHRTLTATAAGAAEHAEAEHLLVGWLRLLVERHASAPPEREHDRAAALAVARAVRERLADRALSPPALAEIAADLNMSRYQVLRTFKSVAGMPPYAWLAQHRVQRARTLLAAGARPAEAAAGAGFADQAHLTRWFRRVLGTTPAAYRAEVRG